MNEDAKKLRSELALVKLQFSERIKAVESRLNSLIAQEKIDDDHSNPQLLVNERELPLVNQPIPSTPASAEFEPTADSTTAKKHLERPAAKPSHITVMLNIFISWFFDWLSPVTKIYQSYKERGMLGLFLLTIVGIGLTLAGFGYLMQLLIDELGVGAKSLLMSFAALLVLGLGIALKIKTRFSEFATAIVTLGILIAYSSVYFSGSVYGLLPNILVLILYLAIALGCHAIALWLDTKIVAALGIVGVATMPLLSGTISLDPVYYLLSLAFVICSSLVLAFRYVGHWLAQLSLAFTLLSLEWIIGFENISMSAWIVNLFYLLFFTYSVASLLKEKTSTKHLLVFLAAIVASTVLIFFQATNVFSTAISLSFAFNAAIASAVSVFFYKVQRELSSFFILLAASWLILAIISAISDAYWGIAWAIEGLLLLVIGRRYQISSTINQGQMLTAAALLYSLAALAAYFPLPALQSVDGWLLSIIIATVMAIWQRLINSSSLFNSFTQQQVKPALQLLEVIWLSILIIASADVWLGNWTGVMVILMQLAILFRAKKCQQTPIEIFAAVLILVPIFYIYQGALLADSYRFTLLPLFAKLSVISVFIQLWLWSAFYRKYYPDSAMSSWAESARILFYMLIPLCWVASVVRKFDEAAIMLLWLSPLLALLLARKVGHQLLLKETKVLTALASVSFVIILSVIQLPAFNSFMALLGFSSFYGAAYLLNRRTSADIFQFICSWGLVSLGIVLPSILILQTGDSLKGSIFAVLYWSLAFSFISASSHCKRNEIIITLVNAILVIGAWASMPIHIGYAMVPVLFLVSAIYQKEQRLKQTLLGKTLNMNSDLFLHSILAVTYVMLFYSLSQYRLELLVAPALAIHGALILFLKDRRLTTLKYGFGLISLGILKLAMLDAANALLWQKVILFMGIGVFILAASFWYQKLVSVAQPLVIDTANKGLRQ